jgi:hypothetical protein
VRRTGDTVTLWWQERRSSDQPCNGDAIEGPFTAVVRGLRPGTYSVRLEGNQSSPQLLGPVTLH